MPRPTPYWQYDVFTRVPFGGNPLAIFPEAEGLKDDEMQALARETNCSETTFVLPPVLAGGSDRARVRIFTPRKEIPFAGHPVVGTAWALVERGRLAAGAGGVVTLELGIERVASYAVDVERDAGGDLRGVTMTQGAPAIGPDLSERDWAPALAAMGVPWEAVADGLPMAVASTGLPFLMVPLVSDETLAALRPDAGPLEGALAAIGAEGAYVFVLGGDRRTVQARSFCPGLSVPEDPATGSAAGALGAYLRARGTVKGDSEVAEIRIRQGASMSRPSEITVFVDGSRATPRVRVRGEAVVVFEGVARLR